MMSARQPDEARRQRPITIVRDFMPDLGRQALALLRLLGHFTEALRPQPEARGGSRSQRRDSSANLEEIHQNDSRDSRSTSSDLD
jgi:hypothetical protein